MKKRIRAADINEFIAELDKSFGTITSEKSELWKELLYWYDKAVKLNYKKGIVALSNGISAFYLNNWKYNEAEPYLLNAKKISEEYGFTKSLANTLLQLSDLHSIKRNFTEALAAVDTVINTLAPALGNEQLAYAHNNKGIVYANQGLFYNALYSFQKASALMQQVNKNLYYAFKLNEIRAYKELSLFEEAFAACLLIIAELKESVVPTQLVRVLFTASNICGEGLNDYKKCKQYYDEGVKLCDKLNIVEHKKLARANWAIDLVSLKKYEEALPILLEEDVQKLIAPSVREKIEVNNVLAECLLNSKQWKEAKKYIDNNNKLKKHWSQGGQVAKHYENCFLFYTHSNKPQQALKYYYLAKEAVVKGTKVEHSLQVKQLNALMELDKKENELTMKKMQEQISSQELELAKQQNALMQTQIDQHNALIDEFQLTIKKIEKSDRRRTEIFKALNDKIKSVRSGLNKATEYETRFNETHQKKIERLKSRHPTLTYGEAKIGVMLASGLSNKEIALFTLTTTRNVETHRLKLRKKMALKRADDLLAELRREIGE